MAGADQLKVSFWTIIPEPLRWAALPTAIAALLVGAGEDIGRLFYLLVDAGPCAKILENPKVCSERVFDAKAVLLFLNLLLALFVFQKIMKIEAKSPTNDIDLGGRLTNFLSLFLSATELLKISVAARDPIYAAIGGIAIFYFLLVPFFVGGVVSNHPAGQGDEAEERKRDRREALRIFSRLVGRLSFAGVLAAGSCALIVLLFYEAMNGGPHFGKDVPLCWLLDRPGKEGERCGYWIINPSLALGIGGLQIALFRHAREWRPERFNGMLLSETLRYEPNRSAILVLAFIGIVLNLVAAPFTVSNATILYSTTEAAKMSAVFHILTKALAVTIYMVALFTAAWLSTRLLKGGVQSIVGSLTIAVPLFAVAGAMAGFGLIVLRLSAGGGGWEHWHLLWLHGISFALVAFPLTLLGLTRPEPVR